MRTLSPGPPSRASCPGPPISTSSPLPPFKVSLPAPPMRMSSPSPPLAVSSMPVSPAAVMTSSPPSPLMPMRSFASKLQIVTSSGRPDTVITPLLFVTEITSSPLVALMTIVSAAPSPPALPGCAPRSMATWLTPVPVRSLTVMVSASPRALTSMCSTPLRSMVTVPMSRVSLARLPLAEMSIFSHVGAVEAQRIGARLALDRVAGVTRVPNERVVARAEQRQVVASAADDDVVALAAGDGVVAGTAVDREIDLAGVKRRSVDGVVAGAPADHERVVGGLGPGDRHLRRQSVDDHRCPVAGDGDAVVAGGAIDGHAVGRSVALARSRRCRQVDGDLLDVGSGEVVDRDGVGAAHGIDLDLLDAVEVHGDVADVAGKAHPLTIGGDDPVLADVGSIEYQRIRAGLAFDRVAAVARIPLEHVVAGAKEGDVVALIAVDEVFAIPAEETVGAAAAEQHVVARPAIEGEHRIGEQRRGREGIVAGATGA